MKLMIVEMIHEEGTDLAAWSTSGAIAPAEAFDRLIRVLAESKKTMPPSMRAARCSAVTLLPIG